MDYNPALRAPVVFETVQSGPYSSFECFSALKGTHFYILFVNGADLSLVEQVHRTALYL